jgi:hypothetical protein
LPGSLAGFLGSLASTFADFSGSLCGSLSDFARGLSSPFADLLGSLTGALTDIFHRRLGP